MYMVSIHFLLLSFLSVFVFLYWRCGSPPRFWTSPAPASCRSRRPTRQKGQALPKPRLPVSKDELRRVYLRAAPPRPHKSAFFTSVAVANGRTSEENVREAKRQIRAAKLVHLEMVFSKPNIVNHGE